MPVNCRIGSLEINADVVSIKSQVNCRIGSLEIRKYSVHMTKRVNCRIGSLEKGNCCRA